MLEGEKLLVDFGTDPGGDLAFVVEQDVQGALELNVGASIIMIPNGKIVRVERYLLHFHQGERLARVFGRLFKWFLIMRATLPSPSFLSSHLSIPDRTSSPS